MAFSGMNRSFFRTIDEDCLSETLVVHWRKLFSNLDDCQNAVGKEIYATRSVSEDFYVVEEDHLALFLYLF